MAYEFLDGDIIITDNKEQVLKNLKKMVNIRLLTVLEFKEAYFGKVGVEALYYLIKKNNYKYDIAKMYLDNYLFIPELKAELEKENLITYEPLFKERIKRIVILTPYIDDYLLDEIKKYPWCQISLDLGKNTPEVNEYPTIEDEVKNVALKIADLLKTIDINKISLVIPTEYKILVKRIFTIFNIPLNLEIANHLYSLTLVQEFLKKLKIEHNLESALEIIKSSAVYNQIITIINKYQLLPLDDTTIYLIEEDLKLLKKDSRKLKNAVNVCQINEINENGYYFILGFNEGIVPPIVKDEDYFSDKEKENLGLMTSLTINNLNKLIIKEKISKYNVFLSYNLKSGKTDNYPSSLITEMNLAVIKKHNNIYNYSNLDNKLTLGKKLDNFLKFNEYDQELEILYHNYPDIPYLTYDNTYHQINPDVFLKYVPNLVLAYTSLDNYYRCGFRYYLNYILKVNKYEETFMTLIGNLFHTILANPEIDLDVSYHNFLENKVFNAKEKFFLTKLKDEVQFAKEVIQKQQARGVLDKALYEEKINIPLTDNITFTGIIDKVMYHEENEKTYFAIIDYKTGNVASSLDNLIYGIEMQLPIYLYLSDYLHLKNPVIIGFYLQKILHPKPNYQKDKTYQEEKEKLYRLSGFSTTNEDALIYLDKDYQNSTVVKSLKKSAKGFYNYAKVLSEDNFNQIKDIVKNKITESAMAIKSAKFPINPKKIGTDLKGCEFCSFKDICYRREEDIINFEEKSYKDFLGGDVNA